MKYLKILDKVDDLCSGLGVAFFIIMTGAAFIQVVSRYCLGNTLSWPEETCRFSFIWLAYMGMSSCMRRDTHLKVDIFTAKLSGLRSLVVYGLDMIISAAFFAFACYCGIEMLALVTESEQQALTLPIPLVFVWAAIPLTFGLSAVYALAHIARAINAAKQHKGSARS